MEYSQQRIIAANASVKLKICKGLITFSARNNIPFCHCFHIWAIPLISSVCILAPLLNFCWELKERAKPAVPELLETEFDVLKSEGHVKTFCTVFYNSFLRSTQLEVSKHPGSRVSHGRCWDRVQRVLPPTPAWVVGTRIGLKTAAQRQDRSAC